MIVSLFLFSSLLFVKQCIDTFCLCRAKAGAPPTSFTRCLCGYFERLIIPAVSLEVHHHEESQDFASEDCASAVELDRVVAVCRYHLPRPERNRKANTDLNGLSA